MLGERRPAALRPGRRRPLAGAGARTPTTAIGATASPSPPTAGWRPRATTASCGSTTPTAGCCCRRSRRRHAQPYGLAFNPVDGRLAVGFDDAPEVRALRRHHARRAAGAGHRRHRQRQPHRASPGRRTARRCSRRAGTTTAAAARWSPGTAAAPGRAGCCRPADNTVMSLRPLPDGALLVAAARPLARAAGGRRHAALDARPGADRPARPAEQPRGLARRHAGRVRPEAMGGEDRRRFDVAALQAAAAGRGRPRRAAACRTASPSPTGMNSTAPTLDGAPLPLEPYEIVAQPGDRPRRRPLPARHRVVAARLRRQAAPRSGSARCPASSGR